MSSENYNEIINVHVLDNLHKAIRMLKMQYPTTKNADGSMSSNIEFLNACYPLNNSVQQYISLQINAYSRFTNYDFANDNIIEPETAIVEPILNDTTNAPIKPKKKRKHKKKAVTNNNETIIKDSDIADIADLAILQVIDNLDISDFLFKDTFRNRTQKTEETQETQETDISEEV